jgi:large subunit ribosomal protein L5
LRPWTGDSPYFENRAWKGPRGGDTLLPKHKVITFRNIPQVTRVTVHSHVPRAQSESAWLHVCGIALQSITNKRVTTHISKTAVQEWGIKKGKWTAASVNLEGEDMYHFISKLVDLVLPRIKDWKGVGGTSGDATGNITFGLRPEDVALFPEIEVNYDMYPQEMIPGCHITIHTSAVTDREARLLLSAIGIPFYGKPKKR